MSLFFAGAALYAQTAGDAGSASSPVFPVHRLWNEARGAVPAWRPDWPLAIPPDSFEPAARGSARQITLTVTMKPEPSAENAAPTDAAAAQNSGDAPSPPLVLKLRKNSGGRMTAFPFLLDGQLYQADVSYRGAEIDVITVSGNGMAAEVSFLEYRNELPYLARIAVSSGEGGADGEPPSGATPGAALPAGQSPVYSFAAFKWYADECIELWSTAEGAPLAVFGDEGVFHHDSMDNITYIKNGETEASARYNARGVRYWVKDGKQYDVERDGRGLIMRLVERETDGAETEPDGANGVDGRDGEAAASLAGEAPVDYRYEYTFGADNLWTQRREFRWTEFNGYLVSSEGGLVDRTIDGRVDVQGEIR